MSNETQAKGENPKSHRRSNAAPLARDESQQRRETMRKIQSEDLSLEMVHPDAAGIDIGNEIPLCSCTADARQPTGATLRVHHSGAEGDGRMAEAMRDPDRRDAIHWRVLDCGVRHSRRSWFGSIPGECAGDEESAGAQERRAGESVADEAAHLRAVAKFVSAVAGDPQAANVLASAQ